MTKRIAIMTAGLVSLLALGALALSYNALREVALDNGLASWASYIWPLLIDLSLIVFSLAIVRNSLRGEATTWPWFLVGLFSLFTLLFNGLHAEPKVISIFVAIIPPVALLLSFETLMGQLRHEVKRSEAVTSLEELALQEEKLSASIDRLTAKEEKLKAVISGQKEKTVTATSTKTKAKAKEIIAQRPGISGSELGRLLGRSESLGRKLKAEFSGNGVSHG